MLLMFLLILEKKKKSEILRLEMIDIYLVESSFLEKQVTIGEKGVCWTK